MQKWEVLNAWGNIFSLNAEEEDLNILVNLAKMLYDTYFKVCISSRK